MAKNSTSIVGKLLLSAKRVPRSLQQAFYFVVRAVSSTRVISAVVTQRKPTGKLSRNLSNPLTYSEELIQ